MRIRGLAAAVTAALVMWSALALAQWNDRTILKFSSAVMVPGATLPPGSYVFELADSSTNRNLVRITNQETNDVITMTQAVPIKRAEASDDVIVQFNPTDGTVPAAIKSWFYPGSEYGHEFVYPEEQARRIAERTKTVVLSIDVPGSDLEQGVLRTFDARGTRNEWRGDAAVMAEWNSRRPNGDVAERARATAPAVTTPFRGIRVQLDDLEDNAARYAGQQISVDGEVDDVYGPRLFSIDDPRAGALGGEMLVLMPTSLAALVKENDRVTISGTVRPFVRTEIEREWGWLGLDPELEVEVGTKPIIVAERLVGGGNDFAMVINAPKASPPRAVGTAGTAIPLTEANAIANAGINMVGQPARLTGIRVAAPGQHGFFVRAGNRHVYVLPTQPVTVTAGDAVTIDGVVLQMPRGMTAQLNGPAGLNERVYIYALNVSQ